HSREWRKGEHTQGGDLCFEAEIEGHEIADLVHQEQLLLDVGASRPARFDRIVAVELIAADDAVDASAVGDPDSGVAVLVVVQEAGAEAEIRPADILGTRASGEDEA